MLNPGSNDVSFSRVGSEGGKNSGGITLRTATGKSDFSRFRTEQSRYLYPGLFNSLPDLTTKGVHARWVAVGFR